MFMLMSKCEPVLTVEKKAIIDDHPCLTLSSEAREEQAREEWPFERSVRELLSRLSNWTDISQFCFSCARWSRVKADGLRQKSARYFHGRCNRGQACSVLLYLNAERISEQILVGLQNNRMAEHQWILLTFENVQILWQMYTKTVLMRCIQTKTQWNFILRMFVKRPVSCYFFVT